MAKNEAAAQFFAKTRQKRSKRIFVKRLVSVQRSFNVFVGDDFAFVLHEKFQKVNFHVREMHFVVFDGEDFASILVGNPFVVGEHPS